VEPEVFEHLKQAVLEGRVSMSRLKDAVRKVLELKASVGLTESGEKGIPEPEQLARTAQKIADKAICVIRNGDSLLPLSAEPGCHFLLCNLTEQEDGPDVVSFDTLRLELEKRGFGVSVLTNPGHRDVEAILDTKRPCCVLVNSRLSANECNGSSLRLSFRQMMCFWRGLILRCPKVIFTSFGDPYKIREVPFLRTYVNAFSSTVEMQKAFVKVLLGEIEPQGKHPVSLPEYF